MLPVIEAICCGMVVGFSLGLTGGGGGIFAVPLLMYRLSVPFAEAVGISLASVGGTALMGAIPRWQRGEIDLRTGTIFALGGILGAPIGNLLSDYIPESMLMVLFGGLMLFVAVRMWNKARQMENALKNDDAPASSKLKICRRDDTGKLVFTFASMGLLFVLGVLTGILTRLFGVGGGFVIVPALVLFTGMEIHTAIATFADDHCGK